MSLNWKEINLVLEELNLPGCQIQKAIQSAFDVLCLKLYGRDGARTLLISLTPGACRLHETLLPKPPRSAGDKPLRFAEFLNARLVNRRIEEAVQLGDNRIVRLTTGDCRVYIRLWSNAANVIVTDPDGRILDAMRRLPRRGEVSGGVYRPEETPPSPGSPRACDVRDLPGEGSFNRRLDAFYTAAGGALSLEALRDQARARYEGSIARLTAALEKLRDKETDYAAADRFKVYGDLILANLGALEPGAPWLEAENFYNPGEVLRIPLAPGSRTPVEAAEDYYEKYRKAKSGLEDLRAEIDAGEREREDLRAALEKLLAETNPLVLHKLLRAGPRGQPAPGKAGREDERRPGLSFRRGDWLIIVGRDAAENDALLRRHVRGNDLWLHARDVPGSYVFVKNRPGKTVPLDILLDAGTLALFYSKARASGEGDLFYTPVKYLRRAKNGPRGLVLPTQEKNLHVKVDPARLRALESCRVK